MENVNHRAKKMLQTIKIGVTFAKEQNQLL